MLSTAVSDDLCYGLWVLFCVFLRPGDKVTVRGYKNRVFLCIFGWDKLKPCLYLLFIINVFYGVTHIRYIFILLIDWFPRVPSAWAIKPDLLFVHSTMRIMFKKKITFERNSFFLFISVSLLLACLSLNKRLN